MLRERIMGDRIYRACIGASLLAALLMGSPELFMGIIGVMYLEGITNWRIPLVVGKFNYAVASGIGGQEVVSSKIPFDAERMFRLVAATMLLATSLYITDLLWWFPWFIGFVFFFAGVSGICPMIMVLRYLGFR